MKSKYLLFVLLVFIIFIPIVHAKDITLSLDQKEYYFKIGENAIINLQSNNTYEKNIDGMLSYTVTQSVNQGSFQMSSSNTQSTSLSVPEGQTQLPLSFGTSNTPITLIIGLKFSYTQNESREVNLNNIQIHFVNDNSQKNNTQNQVSSSSTQTNNAVSSQQDPMEQQMQQTMNQMNGNTQQNQQSQQQSLQQSLQNNQMPQDSSALKQQIQNQIQEQEQMKNEFQKQLTQNSKFQKEHQNLIDQGYNLTDANLNPTSNNTGSFELNYQKPNGEQASLKGQMQDGQMQNLQKDTPESRQQMLDKLAQNKQFQKYQKQLQEQGYAKNTTQFSQNINTTSLQANYINKNNQTVTITADIINNTVQNVKLNNTKEDKNNHNYYYWVLLLLIFVIIGYFTYKKLKKKNNSKGTIAHKILEKPFNYKAEARLMLIKAKKLFEEKEHKEAYGLAGQALRLYLSYEYGLKKETTNDEILVHLKKHNKEYTEIKECFDMCSMVEFAKYQANTKDFDKIVFYVQKIIDRDK